MEDVKEHRYEPNIITRDREPVEFSCFRLTEYVGSDDAEATNSTGASANGSEYDAAHFFDLSGPGTVLRFTQRLHAHPAEVRRPAPDCRHRLEPQPQEIPAAGKAVKGHGKA